jgi:hypothetical protein
MLRNLPVEIEWIITNEQWGKLARLSRLPDEARPGINEGITVHRKNRPDELGMRAPAETRQDLDDLRDQALALKTALTRINDDPALLWASTTASEGEDASTKEANAKAVIADADLVLGKVSTLLEKASTSLERGKTGRRVEVPRTVIHFLHLILLSFTGKGITLDKRRTGDDYSTWEFTIEVLKLTGDHTLKESTIRNTIRNLPNWTQEEAAYLLGFTEEAPDSITLLEAVAEHIDHFERFVADLKQLRRERPQN